MQVPNWVSGLKRPTQVGFAAGLLTAIFSLTLPNQYKSEVRVLPADARGGGVGNLAAMAGAAAAVGISIPGQESADAAYVDILNSRRLREQLLQSTYHFHVRTWRFGVEQAREQTLIEFLDKKNLDGAVKALKENITVVRDLKTKLLTITVETESPDLSQSVAQRLVHQLNEFVVAISQTRGGAKATFAERRLAEARQELSQAENEFRTFLDGNRNYLLSSDAKVRLTGLRLENELKLRTQLVSTLAVSREQALLEEKNDLPILNVLDAANLPIEKSGPARSLIVLLVTALGFGSALAWLHREWIQAWLLADDVDSAVIHGEHNA